MALSDYERKMLEELEAQLSDDDPSFASSMAPESTTAYARQLSIRHVVLGTLAVIIGIAILVAGVHTGIVPVGVGGVVIMFLGAWYISAGITREEIEVVRSAAPKPRRQANPGGFLQEFMERQARQWEDRRDEGR